MIRRGLTLALLALAACSEPEVLLEGERLDVRGNPIPAESVNRALPLPLPAAVRNADWTHAGGNTQHSFAHAALDRDLSLAWRVPIGEGNDRKHRISADPVVSGGRIFTMDSRARVTAVSTGGAVLWSVDLTPAADASDEGSGGGIAATGGRVYVTTGFGELSVLDAATGAVVWRQDFDAAVTAPPTVSGGVVYVVTRNAIGWALSADTGRILWQVYGTTADRSSTGGPSPLVAGRLVVFPFASGQMVSAVAGSGDQAWAASVAGQRLGRAAAVLSDFAGSPIHAGDTIYAGSHAGRAAAFNATTGRQVWSAGEGASGPLWLAGGALFFVSDRNQLVRLDAATGQTVWTRDLPYFTRERIRRRKSIHVHHGPVLAGGRLILVSDDGVLRQIDPVSGAVTARMELPDGAARNPVVAGGVLYVVTEDGQLAAFR